MKIVHLSNDLMMNSQIAQIARGSHLQLVTIRQVDAIPASLPPDGGLLILDLQCPGWSAEAFTQIAAGLPKTWHAVAYAQHVLPELLAEAQAAGIADVMTRGKFSREISAIIASLKSQSSPSSPATKSRA